MKDINEMTQDELKNLVWNLRNELDTVNEQAEKLEFLLSTALEEYNLPKSMKYIDPHKATKAMNGTDESTEAIYSSKVCIEYGNLMKIISIAYDYSYQVEQLSSDRK